MYTYSRCRRQCETEELVREAGCKDAFMPGMII